MATSVRVLDDAVKEYLLFRGFSDTLRAFESDIKTDREKGFQVDKIVQHLFSCVSACNLSGMTSYWEHLDRRFFVRLQAASQPSVRKLELCLRRYYIVHAVQVGRLDRVTEFFTQLGPELAAQPEWQEWFTLPFLRAPESHPSFETFFTRSWLDSFTFSLHNFLSTVFQNLPLPVLLARSADHLRVEALEGELQSLRSAARTRASDAHLAANSIPVSAMASPTTKVPETAQLAAMAAAAGTESTTAVTGTGTGLGTGAAELVAIAGSELAAEGNIQHRTAPATPSLSSPGNAGSAIGPDSGEGGDTATTEASSGSGGGSSSPTIAGGIGGRRGSSTEATSSAHMAPDGASENRSDVSEEGRHFIVLNRDAYTGHQAAVVHVCAAVHGATVATADVAGDVHIWACQTLAARHSCSFGVPILSLAWEQQNERWLLAGLPDGRIVRVDVSTGAEVVYRSDTPGSTPPMSSSLDDTAVAPAATVTATTYPRAERLACSPDGKCVVAALVDTTGTRGRIAILSLEPLQLLDTMVVATGEPRVSCLNFNHNGTLLVAGTAEGDMLILDMVSRSVRMQWAAHTGEVCHCSFSHDETTLFTSGTDGTIKQWNGMQVGQQTCITQVAPHASPSGIVPPDSMRFAIGDADAYLVVSARTVLPASAGETAGGAGAGIFRVTSEGSALGGAVLRLDGHDAPVTSVEWCPGHDTVITGAADGSIGVHALFRVS